MTTVENKSAIYSLETEAALIGSIILNPDDTWRDVRSIVNPSDLYLHKHQFVWNAVVRIIERHETVDFVTLCNELESAGHLQEIGGQAFIVRLMSDVPNSLHAIDYANAIRRDALRRRLLEAASIVAKLAYAEDRPIVDVMTDALSAVKAVAMQGQSSADTLRPSTETLSQLYDMLRAPDALKRLLLPTGLSALDAVIGGGLEPKTSSVVMGRAGMGKSAMLVQISEAVATSGAVVAVFSKEMNSLQWMRRMACRLARVNWDTFKRGQCPEIDEERVYEKTIELSAKTDGRLWIDDSASQTTEQVRALCEKLIDKTGRLDLVIVDHLRLFSDKERGEPEVKRLGRISWSFKQMAKDMNTRVLFAAQINRGVEQRENKVPDLADLRDSGEIEENADMVIAVHRDDYYNPEADPVAEFWVRKNREGARNDVGRMAWVPEYQSFEKLTTVTETVDLRNV
jgi:replicative DNA helicase